MLHETVTPEGWAPAKGYANGVVATGRLLFLGGQIGWNADQVFETDDFIEQMTQTLENIKAIGSPQVTSTLKNFLVKNLPATKSSKKQKFALGISDAKLGPELFADTGITAVHNDTTMELMRGIRLHYAKVIDSKFTSTTT